MTCASCGHTNPERAKFCLECGQPFASRCAQCGAELPARAKFCTECGAENRLLGDRLLVVGGKSPSGPPNNLTTNNPRTSPRSYTPKHLADKILQSKSALEGERKQVTVLFADVKGSMELAEQLDPEQWHALLDRFFQILTDGVHRFEGTVNQYTGDGVMALFGAPIAHEDHAQRACFTALALRDALREFARDVKRRHGLDFATRIGLNSGEVVVGRIGDDLRMDYTAQGHTVGLAQRMEALASGGGIYVSEHTHKLARVYFALDDLGEFTIKGVSEPMHVYELTGVGSARTRFDLSVARGLVRFVGRDAELHTLEAALERTRRGEGQVLGIVADAGTGKSRLCFEFAERCRAQGVTVMQGRCVAHGKHLPLLPVLEVIRGYFGVDDGDDERVVREKIAGRLLLLDDTYRDELPVLFEFLGVPDPERPAPALPPEARQRRLFGLLRRLTQGGGASGQEVGLVWFEDLHWIDAASEAWLAEWVNATLGGRTLLLLNFRPEYRAEWMQRAHYQQLALAPLTAEAIQELIVDLIGTHPSTAGLARRIHVHTGGNPFFAEEVVQMLIESGQLTGARGSYRLEAAVERLEVPPTVQALLAARIDRLAEREKRVLQSAAVIGKDFAEPLLAAVAGLPERELGEALAWLRSGEFLHERSLYPIAEYSFKHPLTQAVAQDSLLGERRRALHADVARAIEAAGGDLDEQAALLAHHWGEAGEAEPAALWHRRAANWIAGSNSAEARQHWNRVRELADQVKDPALALELGQQSRLMILEYGWRLGISEVEANELLHEGESWARRNDDPRALAALYNAFSMPCMFSLGNPRRARELAEEGLRLAEQAGDSVLACALELRVFFSSERLGLATAMSEAMEAVRRRPPEDLERASSLVGYNVPAAVAGFNGWAHASQGQLDAALDHYRRGIALARANEAVEVVGWLLGIESSLCCERGEIGRASAAAREALEIAERIESPLSQAIALHNCGRTLAFTGDPRAAVTTLERGLSFAERIHLCLEAEILSDLALAHCALGALPEARAAAERAVEVAVKRGQLAAEVIALHALGRVHLEDDADGSRTEARRLLDRAESKAEEIGYRLIRPRLCELRAELSRREGDPDGADAALREARRLYREMGASARAERLEE